MKLDLGTGRILTYWRGRPASSEQEAFENMVAEMKRRPGCPAYADCMRQRAAGSRVRDPAAR